MIAHLALKELRDNLLSLRFYLAFSLAVGLFIAGSFVSVGSFRLRSQDYRGDVAANDEAIRAAGSVSGLARLAQTLDQAPNPNEIISDGNRKDLPNRFSGDIYETAFPEIKGRGNAYLRDFRGLDWEFVVAVVLSFLAFVLSHDAVTSEKERGTLSLLFANSVRAAEVYLGKFLGLWAAIALPLVAGTAAGLLIVRLGGIPLGTGPTGLFLAASSLYLGFFLLVGMAISSLTSRSLTSAIALLSIWVLAAFVVPSSGRLAARFVSPAPARKTVVERLDRVINEIYNARYLKTLAGRWDGNPRQPWVPLRSRWVEEVTAARNRIADEYMRSLIRQAGRTSALVRLSPVGLFSGLTEEIAGTGLGGFESLYARVLRYRGELYRFVADRDREDPESVHLVPLAAWQPEAVSGRPVAFDLVPRFDGRVPPLAERAPRLVRGFAILAALGLAVFAFGSLVFARYDKR